MISELDDTIKQLLVKEGSLDASEVDVRFEIPTREWSAGISKPTLNCYLFDIRENVDLRQQGWQKEQAGAVTARRHSPLRYDLTYLITVWTRAIEDEHRLLWHTLQTLSRFPTLPGSYLQGALQEHDLPVYANIARSEGVLKSPGEFWTALENQLKPSLSYVITLAMDRDAIPMGPPVMSTSLRFRAPGTEAEELLGLGGTISGSDGAPIVGATVMLEGRSQRASTDAQGRYHLRGVGAGRHTLVVQAGGREQRREIDIPELTYNMTLDPERG